jgi:hypothetical protein
MNKFSAPFYYLRYGKNFEVLFRKMRHGKPPRFYCGRKTAPLNSTGRADIKDRLLHGKPLFAGRLGHTENYILIDHEFVTAGLYKRYSDYIFERSKIDSGMFSATPEGFDVFSKYTLDALRNITDLQIWFLKMEPYWIKHYCHRGVQLYCDDGIWDANDPEPITSYLRGRKVLIVSSFTDTMAKQYPNRHQIYPSRPILPDFAKISFVKAPVTFAGNVPTWPTWEDALLDTYAQCKKCDYDVALIGAGSYSLPLGNLLFKDGKQVIVLNSRIQLLFGIKGQRFIDHPEFGFASYFNDYWVRPSSEEKPKNAQTVDYGHNDYW